MEMASVRFVVYVVCLSLDGSIVLVKDRQVISLPNISFRMSCNFVYIFSLCLSYACFINYNKIYLTKGYN